MNSVEDILAEMKKVASAKTWASQKHFGIVTGNNFGMTAPQMRVLAKQIGTNQPLALELWETKIHEARHIALMIADPNAASEKVMEYLLKDFNSWDIVDNACSSLFRKTPLAYRKALEWSRREKEFEKRAGFTMMAQLAVHDKNERDSAFEDFLPVILRESSDERNFVRKAVNWALRQIGKRNARLCKKAIATAKQIYKKGDRSSKWIASDALRELQKYRAEGKIRSVGVKG